jgi:hypothetical protein
MNPHPGDLGKSAWGYGFFTAILGAQYFIAAHSGITLTPTEALVHRPLDRKRGVPWADVEAVAITGTPFGHVTLGTTSGEGIVVPVLTLSRRRLDAIGTKIDQCRTEHRDDGQGAPPTTQP